MRATFRRSAASPCLPGGWIEPSASSCTRSAPTRDHKERETAGTYGCGRYHPHWPGHFRNDDRLFGIKHEDRFSHVYVIGKTGTGKSTLIEMMALQDLERGNGFALIDPHGDLVARIAARVSESQRSRVIYLNTTDPEQPYGYNPLRHVSEDRIALAASGMMDVFKKMWPDAWACAWSTSCAMCSWRSWNNRMRRSTTCPLSKLPRKQLVLLAFRGTARPSAEPRHEPSLQVLMLMHLQWGGGSARPYPGLRTVG